MNWIGMKGMLFVTIWLMRELFCERGISAITALHGVLIDARQVSDRQVTAWQN